jgi:hypothetical protein
MDPFRGRCLVHTDTDGLVPWTDQKINTLVPGTLSVFGTFLQYRAEILATLGHEASAEVERQRAEEHYVAVG